MFLIRPALSGHLRNPQGWPLNTGSTVECHLSLNQDLLQIKFWLYTRCHFRVSERYNFKTCNVYLSDTRIYFTYYLLYPSLFDLGPVHMSPAIRDIFSLKILRFFKNVSGKLSGCFGHARLSNRWRIGIYENPCSAGKWHHDKIDIEYEYIE